MKKIFFVYLFVLVFSTISLAQIKFENGSIISSSDLEKYSRKVYLTDKPYDNFIYAVYFNKNKKDQDKRIYFNPFVKSGIVEVKYNSTNGKIHKGDPVTSSSVPGEAMKATEPGMILGIALEDAKAEKGLIKIRVLIQYLR